MTRAWPAWLLPVVLLLGCIAPTESPHAATFSGAASRPVPSVVRVRFSVASVDTQPREVQPVAAAVTDGARIGSGPSPRAARSTAPRGTQPLTPRTCRASWYARGTTTASGERFDPEDMTAASRTLPFGSVVKVTRVDKTGRDIASVQVRVNDFGPAKRLHRCIDLSRGAMRVLGGLDAGVIDVRLEVLA